MRDREGEQGRPRKGKVRRGEEQEGRDRGEGKSTDTKSNLHKIKSNKSFQRSSYYRYETQGNFPSWSSCKEGDF